MRQVSVEITQRCLNRCLHCSSQAGIECITCIPFNPLKHIVDDMVTLGMDLLCISGGEPMTHVMVYDLIEYAKRKGITVYLYTSGIMFDEQNQPCCMTKDVMKLLVESGVDRLVFDLPAVDEEVYDRFMGTENRLKMAKQSILNAVSFNVFTDIHFVPTTINVSQVDAVLEFAKQNHVNQVSFLGLVEHGRAKSHPELKLNAYELELLKRKLYGLQDDIVRIGMPLQLNINGLGCCNAGLDKLCVKYDGTVYGCEAFKYIELKDERGNVIQPDSIYCRRLADIYRNSEYLNAEARFVRQQLCKNGCSSKCPVQRSMD